MFKLNRKIISAFIIVLSFVLAGTVLAQVETGIGYAESIGLGNADPRVMAANIIRIVLGFLGIIAVGLLMYGGWLWMTSNGAADKVEKAKKLLISAGIGLLLILSSFAIATFVLNSLIRATGGAGAACADGETMPCGCNGLRSCANGSWGNCEGSDCGSPNAGLTSCDGNALTPECEEDASLCDPETQYCGNDCYCHNQGGYGSPCDENTATAECDLNDDMCAVYLRCDEAEGCICVGAPVIEWISPVDELDIPNGAPGNFITIGGRYFGTTTGEVIFAGGDMDGDGNALGDADDRIAPFPNSVNAECGNNWQDNQIIAVVPTDAADGPIVVRRTDGEIDSTNNDRGPLINNFDVNDIIRPGLCLASPASGYFEDPFNLQGINFDGANRTVRFGDRTASTTAYNISGWSNTSVDAAVPNLRQGRTTVFAQVDGRMSNSLYFIVFIDDADFPSIAYIDPEQGPPGQMITIYGQGFRQYEAGRSAVEFSHPLFGDFAADGNDLPEACRSRWWHNDRIVVKVPPLITNLANYEVRVTNNLGNESPPENFPVIEGEPGPGICLLDPHNGPVGRPVNVYGDNFNNVQGAGFVRFYNNAQAGNYPNWTNQLVGTNVPAGAQTGPVVLSDSVNTSNSLPFTVGFCSDNTMCDAGEECCGNGTYWSGICRAAGTCSQGDPSASAYGWSFTTGNGGSEGEPCYINPQATPSCNTEEGPCAAEFVCDPNTCSCRDAGDIYDSCVERSRNIGRCDSIICPNSPGQCSPYTATGAETETGAICSDSACSGAGACGASDCVYNFNLDRCVNNSAGACGLPFITQDILGNPVTANCARVQTAASVYEPHWSISSNLSCPFGWTRMAGGLCVDLSDTCVLCSDGFACLSDGGVGRCAVLRDICPGDSICNAGGQCVLTDDNSCDCCCEIGQDERDCCYPLTCEGVCGSDTANDGSCFGVCTGCAAAADPDLACNCEGASGKFCDLEAAGGRGACVDCASLNNPDECSSHSTCCIDEMGNNACKGMVVGGARLATGSCGYFSCETNEPFDCEAEPESTGDYRTADCDNACGEGYGLGLDCSAASVLNQTSGVCDLSVCSNPFACLTENGAAPSASEDCGTCCCDPSMAGEDPSDPATYDSCNEWNINNVNLECRENQVPCTGDERGLCCGCEEDTNCGNINSAGCGQDACCRTRPAVAETFPADDATDVCRNAAISAVFNQRMDTSTFSGNVIVLGDYGSDACPAGTQFLADADPKKENIFVRLYRAASKAFKKTLALLPFSNKIMAYTPPAGTRNYCAVAGYGGGYNDVSGRGVMKFNLNKALDGGRLYYVIIKGDDNLADGDKKGVLSGHGISMNGPADLVFNGISYGNSYIFSFTTLPEQAENAGLCVIDHVNISPSSYLINTLQSDPGENDEDITDNSFDSARDNDKLFAASAVSADNQILSSVAGYTWTWAWNPPSNPQVAGYVAVFGLQTYPDFTLVRAGGTATEGQTSISASAVVSGGDIFTGQADVYVFVCDNPWPPIDPATGEWRPWSDAAGNCTIPAGGCTGNYNYNVYYCRDAGKRGTADDLPAIYSDRTVIRGTDQTLVCSDADGECGAGSSAGDVCGEGGVCRINLLKEYYFFREDIPVAGGALTAVDAGTGGAINLSWNLTTGADGYKLYWGRGEGTYENSLDAGNVTSVTITGLFDGQTYYFAYTSYASTGAESGYSSSVSAVPSDATPPPAPAGLTATAGNGQVELFWNQVMDDGEPVKNYKVYYGVNAGQYGHSQNLEDVTRIIIRGLTNGQTYYFAVSALDEAARPNESAQSAEVSATPAE